MSPIEQTLTPSSGSPSATPATSSPTNKPVTDKPTNLPSLEPTANALTVTDIPINSQTLDAPIVESEFDWANKEISMSMSMALQVEETEEKTITSTDMPSKRPTPKPVASITWVTSVPSNPPITDSPTTENPTSISPTIEPSKETVTESPSDYPVHEEEVPFIDFVGEESSTSTTDEVDGLENDRLIQFPIPMSSFYMSLQSNDTIIDSDELELIVSNHVLKEIQSELSSLEVTRVSVSVSFATSFDDESVYKVIGNTYMAGHEMYLPTSETLDTVVQESFVGEKGDEFLQSLQNAEDTGLQSTGWVRTSQIEDEEIDQNELIMIDNDDPLAESELWIIGIVFGACFMLVSLYILKTRHNGGGYRSEDADEVSVRLFL